MRGTIPIETEVIHTYIKCRYEVTIDNYCLTIYMSYYTYYMTIQNMKAQDLNKN